MTKEQLKISIRFFNDREVRAVWDDERFKWWFSVLDVVGILNEESDYTKTRNYWKYLKAKLKKENNQLVSATTQLKLLAADGKKLLLHYYFAGVGLSSVIYLYKINSFRCD